TDDAARESEIRFESKETQRLAPALQRAPMVIESGQLAKMVKAWLQRWTTAEY
ncbi:MAG: hypothetical protein L6R42_005552, partial [Xanthoria sp. 1 TBL-2021]